MRQHNAEIDVIEAKKQDNSRLQNDRLITEARRHPLSARQLLANTTDKSIFSEEQYKKLTEVANSPYP